MFKILLSCDRESYDFAFTWRERIFTWRERMADSLDDTTDLCILAAIIIIRRRRRRREKVKRLWVRPWLRKEGRIWCIRDTNEGTGGRRYTRIHLLPKNVHIRTSLKNCWKRYLPWYPRKTVPWGWPFWQQCDWWSLFDTLQQVNITWHAYY